MADHEEEVEGGEGDEHQIEHEVPVENNPTLPEVDVKTMEEEEDVLFKMYGHCLWYYGILFHGKARQTFPIRQGDVSVEGAWCG